MSELNQVYLVEYKRSAFSRARPNDPDRDVFNSIRMDDVLGMLIKDVVNSSGVKTDDINDVITGCAFQTGENWLYGGRHPVFLAGLPFNVPSMSLDRACSSSLNAIAIGAMEIMTGKSEVTIAGGMEHMTHIPMANNPNLKANMKLLLRPEYAKYNMSTAYNMGLTAEKLAGLRGIPRKEMDEFSAGSHKKSAESMDKGFFRDEILPVTVEINGEEKVIDTDQSIRRDTTIEALSKLPPSFKADGVITAGNSSPLNDGASAVMVMSEKKMKEYGLKPLARIRGFAWASVDPSIMGEGPVPATQKLLRQENLSVDDIDVWEINEAFAVVVLNAIKELGIDPSRVNIHGGAVSIGHPLGASGARLAGTLARIMNEGQKDLGVATLCVGGGQGYSMLLERV
ncbi:MAG: acetyl-CoA C-acetyltransferase [Candidatus Thermoplasmatota archaeon]|nr:acetyl-CoA C-acetyltransferase [Candidatus Thermoplasmatota archaeon]